MYTVYSYFCVPHSWKVRSKNVYNVYISGKGGSAESLRFNPPRIKVLAPFLYASVATRPITMHLEHRIKSNSPPLGEAGKGSL